MVYKNLQRIYSPSNKGDFLNLFTTLKNTAVVSSYFFPDTTGLIVLYILYFVYKFIHPK